MWFVWKHYQVRNNLFKRCEPACGMISADLWPVSGYGKDERAYLLKYIPDIDPGRWFS
jgi:hypothetical protein